MTATDAPSSQTPHHRRSREEMEALAKNFVATPVEAAPAKSSKALLMAGVGGAVVLAGVVAFFALRSGGEGARQETAATAAAARAAAEVEEIRLRMEAERERSRKELEASSDYLERIGAADAALVQDLSDRADRLSARQAAAATVAPAPSADVPTPREETRVATAAPKAAPVQPAKVEPAPVQQAAVAKPEPAKVAPTTVAEAPKCEIHVSELSKSGTLTYDAIKKMKGVRIDDFTGNVFTPPVMTGAGRKVVFEVLPTGCVRVAKR